MAELLGDDSASAQWREKADHVRNKIHEHLFDGQDFFFYDLDAKNNFVPIKTDVITRIAGEHVLDQSNFEEIWTRHLHNPNSFWTDYPFPSVAIDDPGFCEEAMERNAWAGPSMALTAMRAMRWMDFYGKSIEFATMMNRWLRGMSQSNCFPQQMDPRTGEMKVGGNYSPAMCTFVAFTSHLHGVGWTPEGFEWSCTMPEGASMSRFELNTRHGRAELSQSPAGARLFLNGRLILEVEGPGRVLTNHQGDFLSLTRLSHQESCRLKNVYFEKVRAPLAHDKKR